MAAVHQVKTLDANLFHFSLIASGTGNIIEANQK
jgi:hypothetical protein